MELTLTAGVGVGDLQRAARAEANRLIKETGGDDLEITRRLIQKLRDLELIHHGEVEILSRITEIGFDSAGKKDAREAYFEVRGIYNEMLADGRSSQLALILASSAAGSYTMSEEPNGAVVYAKAGSSNWEARLGVAGALIGNQLGGPLGGSLGGLVGGIIGGVIDDCKK